MDVTSDKDLFDFIENLGKDLTNTAVVVDADATNSTTTSPVFSR